MSIRSINKVTLIGNIGKDPELRVTQNGLSIASFNLATSEEWKDKQTGETKESTEWLRIVVYGKLAEIANEYCKKGSQVYIEGKLQVRKWKDESGYENVVPEIIVHSMGGTLFLLGSRNNTSATQQQVPQQAQQQVPQQAQQQVSQQAQQQVPQQAQQQVPQQAQQQVPQQAQQLPVEVEYYDNISF